MFRIAIIEDDDGEAATLRDCIVRFFSEHGGEPAVTRHASGVALLETPDTYDLLFMDIDMPGVDGMRAARELRDRGLSTPLVFVTNLAQYAVRGYEVEALDFLVKPLSYAGFAMHMQRILRVVERERGRTVALKTREGVRVVPLADIISVEVVKHYLLYAIAPDAERLRVRGTIAGAEERLADGSFIRVSNSCLVNMRHVRGISGDAIALTGDVRAYFSRSRRHGALEAIADYVGGDR